MIKVHMIMMLVLFLWHTYRYLDVFLMIYFYACCVKSTSSRKSICALVIFTLQFLEQFSILQNNMKRLYW